MRVRLAYAVAALLAGLGLALAAACGGGDGGDGEGSPTPAPTETAAPTADETPSTGGPSASDLARSVVQVVQLVGDATGAEIIAWGSGSVISAEGLVLTNAHVVDDRLGDYDALGVALTDRTDQPPELTYLAEIVAVDYGLDLAVIQIAYDLEGNPVSLDLPAVSLGDSDTVEIADNLRVLGYPAIGGETITFTDGVVSGFTSERAVTGRAWIKTDAAISGGNSGGLAVNEDGELIGVPTQVGSGTETTEAVDCRYVADTNRDGIIDEGDTCVPVGGFINGLRPVNLAAPLIDAALSGTAYVAEAPPEPAPSGGYDVEQVLLTNLLFADGVTEDDLPTAVWEALPSGQIAVCGFWDYAGMVDGMAWEALWFIDGELNEDGSMLDQTWTGGESGNWWVCILDDTGLPDGLYELALTVEDELQSTNSAFVGGDHPPATFTLANDSSVIVCYVFLSPTLAQNWGPDELGAQEMVDPGLSATVELPAGLYDLLVQDCDQAPLYEERELEIAGDLELTLTD